MFTNCNQREQSKQRTLGNNCTAVTHKTQGLHRQFFFQTKTIDFIIYATIYAYKVFKQ